jgi:ribosomal protein S18 acetylase RimI-like enzyme
MSILSSISRLAEYYRRHGFIDTLRRAQLTMRRQLFAGRMVVFYCDLADRRRVVQAAGPFVATCIRTPAELNDDYLQQMTGFWNGKIAYENIRERFKRGALLWLVVYENGLAGYGWVLHADTIEPYYFPLAQRDAHLFDFHVFPHYRGKGINPYLVDCILDDLASSGSMRAFIEVAEWNKPQLSSLRKTAFRHLGSVRSFTVLGHRFMLWSDARAVETMDSQTTTSSPVATLPNSNQR